MQIRGHEVIQLNKFNGRWNRGQDDVVPPDHAISEQNCEFENGGVRSRRGFNQETTIGSKNILRAHHTPLGILYLATDKKLYNHSVSDVTAIKDWSALTITDFDCVTINNRAYITPIAQAQTEGYPSEFVYVYDGANFRKAAGDYPANAATFAAAASAGAGIVDKGNYVTTVVFETDSGYITGADDNFLLYAAPVNKKITYTNIPTGPTGTAARWILISKVFHKAYSGNFRDYEMFFGVRLAGNVATTVDFNDYSNNLARSADYLFDQLENIPASLGLTTYNGSMVSWAESATNGIVRVSATGEPESFSSVDGFLNLDETDFDFIGITNCIEHRGQLYIIYWNKTKATASNGQEPTSWPIVDIDKTVGSYSHYGISKAVDSEGSFVDFFLLFSTDGLRIYDGAYSPVPLTYKIADDFTIDELTNLTTQVVILSDLHLIFVYSNTFLFVGNYTEGVDSKNIKWSKWDSNYGFMNGIILTDNGAEGFLTVMATFNGKTAMYSLPIRFPSINLFDATATAIDSYYETSYLPPESAGQRNHYDALRAKVTGSGTLAITVTDRTGNVTTPTGFTLATTQGTELERRFDVKAERVKVKVRTSGSTTAYWILNSLNLLVKALGNVLPS